MASTNQYLEKVGGLLSPQYWWLRHSLFWFYRYSDLILGKLGILSELEITLQDFILGYLIPDVVFVYLLLLVLIPKLLLRQKWLLFILGSLVALLVFSGYTYTYNPDPGEEFGTPFTIFFSLDLLDAVHLYTVVLGLRLMLEFISYQTRIAELQQRNLQTELSYLKSQVSPHFLFNMMNNIAVLSEKYPEKVTPVIIQLSNVLRYQLYECDQDQIQLEDDIQNIRNYLALEKVRHTGLEVTIDVKGSPADIMAPPLLFLPFVENAVKHGMNNKGVSRIDMAFVVSTQAIQFNISNTLPDYPGNQPEGGIGLKNIRRRLDLLFPKKYQLNIDHTPNLFKVSLYLQLR